MNLVSMSCTIKSSGSVSEISCHSLFISKYLLSINDCNLYLSMGDCLHSRATQRRAALWRASGPDLNRRLWSWPLLLLYDHVLLVCQCVHNMRSISLDYPGQARLPNWLPAFSKPLSWRVESTAPPCTVHRAADYAARSPPLGCSLFIF